MANSYCNANSKILIGATFALSVLIHSAILLKYKRDHETFHMSNQRQALSSSLSLSLIDRPVTKKIIKKKKKLSKKKKKPIEKIEKVAMAKKSQTVSDSVDPNTKFDNFIRSYKEPTYPRIAIRRKIEGEVTIDLLINKHGKVTSTIVSKSSGHSFLDKSAVEAAKKWTFKPLKSKDLLSLKRNIVFVLKI